jgi:asparagine synthase (glutamine-hydrolysing)
VGHDDPLLFGPASDPATGIRVLSSGRPACDEPDWRRAEGLPFDGGLANRLLVEKYLQGGAEVLGGLNGSCAVVVWDPRSRVHLTDHFGYRPVFLCQPESPQRDPRTFPAR